MLRKGVAVMAVAAALAGCSSSGPTNGQLYGTAGGAVVGAGIGRAVADVATAGTLAGALGGAVVGFALGTYMDPPAQEKHARATISAAEDGKPVAWTTEKGSKGSVTPISAQYTDRSGRSCRPLQQDVTVNDERSVRDVTACQAKDGTWVVTDYQPEKAD
ncbi:MAG: RT0821/Lpp0805 family surface protein [Bacteroidales bacterium]